MAASTVAYTDTTGNRDYLGMIAGQIGRRLKEASDMASDERAYAERKAEEGGTSLDEAGIGRGYFFKRALGSRFGGDRIARTKGRMGMGGAGTNPTGNFKTRFRGGFDYNVTNEIQASTLPLTGALATGLRGVESGLSAVGQSIDGLAVGLGNLARAQEDMARQAVFNGAFMQAFLNHMQREGARQRARSEERGLESGRPRLTGSGGGGGGRNMINVTPPSSSRRFSKGNLGDFASAGTGVTLSKLGGSAAKSGQTAARTAVRGVTTSVASPVFKAGRQINKMLPSATKIAKQTSKAIGLPLGVTKNFFGKAVAGGRFNKAYVDFLSDAVNDKFAGITGLFGPSTISPNFKGGFDDLSKINQENLLTKALTSATGEDELTDLLLKSGYKGNYAGVDSAFPTASRSISKKYGPKTAERIANLSDAGYKSAEIASDQLVRQGMKKGLTRGSGLARTMVKTFGAAGTRSILKKIPILAGIAGTVFAIQRALEGDFLGAGLELTSGLLGATGIGGIGPGLAIDGFLLARDFGMVPMAKGGFLTKPTPVVAGEAGAEGFFPLEGSRGKKTFKMFGEGVLDAQEDNKNAVATMYAMGNKKYFDDMGGWSRFGEKVGNFLKGVKENTVGAEGDGYFGPAWLGIKNWNHPRWQNDADNPNKENVTAMSGSGGSLNLSEQDFKWLAYAVSGEARLGTKDEFAVAASILNRAARGDHGGSIEAIIKAPGQYEAYEKGMMNHNPEILNRLMSPSGQASIVDALRRLDGRTDFKGQTQLHNRVAGEDPMFHRLGNFFHYDYQTGPNSMRPSNYQTPNYQKFIKSSNTGGEAANLLQQMSAQNSMGGMFMPTTIINNNYAAVQGGGGGSEDTFGNAFPTGFAAFAPYYSLASK